MKNTQSNNLDVAIKTVRTFGYKNLTIVFVILIAVIFIGIKISGAKVNNISDTAKIGTLKLIDTALKAQLQAGKVLPIPDDAVTIKIQDQILGYQGYVGSSVSDKISFLSNKKIEAKTYIYFLDPSKTKYQLMTWINKEKKTDSTQTGEQYIIVGALENKQPYFMGTELGMFFEPFTHVAIQDVIKDKNRDLTNTTYPSIQRFNLEKIVDTNPWVLIETMSGLDNKFRSRIDVSKMNSLVGRWKFDEGKGNIVKDSSKYKNNGVIKGAGVSWIKTADGSKGLKLTGSGWVQIPDSDSLDLTDNFTIVVEFEQLGDTRGTLLSKDGVGTDTSRAYNIYTDKGITYEVNNQESIRGGIILTGKINKIILNYQEGKLSLRENSERIVDQKNIVMPRKLTTDLLLGRRGLENNSYLNGIIYSIRFYK